MIQLDRVAPFLKELDSALHENADPAAFAMQLIAKWFTVAERMATVELFRAN